MIQDINEEQTTWLKKIVIDNVLEGTNINLSNLKFNVNGYGNDTGEDYGYNADEIVNLSRLSPELQLELIGMKEVFTKVWDEVKDGYPNDATEVPEGVEEA